jgi:electron transfer flavoprotein beta subunit
MKIAVVMRQVLDLIEPLELTDSETALDLDGATFLVNESDDHALEQALLLKEGSGASVTVVALDCGDVDDTLYAAVAKGADQIIKIPWEDDETAPSPRAAAAMLAEAIKDVEADLVLVGGQAHDELEGSLAPLLALALELPYVGVIRGVKPSGDGASVAAFKEFPGAVMAKMNVKLPALLGILAAEEPPRYVPVSKIRSAMKSTEFEEKEVAAAEPEPVVTITRMYHPEAAERAEIIEGSEEEVASRIVDILLEKGMVK